MQVSRREKWHGGATKARVTVGGREGGREEGTKEGETMGVEIEVG